MRIAALVLGLMGGLTGLLMGACVVFLGGLGSALGSDGADKVQGLGWLAFLASMAGLVGAGMAMSKPKVAAILMIVAAIAGLIGIGFGYIVSTALFGVGGLLAFLGRNSKKSEA